MYEIVRTRQADADLLDIWLYIAQESEEQADILLDTIQERYQILKEHPFLGRSRHELVPGIRSLRAGRYQIFYRVVEQQIELLRVLHGARDLEQIFEINQETLMEGFIQQDVEWELESDE